MDANMEMDVDLRTEMRLDTPRLTVSSPTSVAPTKKRHALSQEAHGITATRKSDDEGISLDVDLMILDYLLHDAIQACLNSPHAVDSAVRRVDDFLALFKVRHSSYTPDPELHFRQLLSQLLILIVNRHRRTSISPPLDSLLSLRAENAARVRTWTQSSTRPTASYTIFQLNESLPKDEVTVNTNRKNALDSLGLDTTQEFYGSEYSISLLDLLPLFMHVSALPVTKIYQSQINDIWMRLATEWILQACLEQYLVCGARGTECIDEAFAWGYQKDGAGVVNAMFEDAEFKVEIEGWKEWKAKSLELLMAEVPEERIQGRLEGLAEENSMKDFEKSIVKYLEALGKCIPEPMLVQLEKGKLEGMSEQATKNFLRECGIGDGGLAAAL